MTQDKFKLRGFQINAMRVHPLFKKMKENEAITFFETVLRHPYDQNILGAYRLKEDFPKKGWTNIQLTEAINEVLNPENHRAGRQMIYPTTQFEISGNSMDNGGKDAIIHGDIVTVGKINTDRWTPNVLINRRRPCLLETVGGQRYLGSIARCGLDRFYIVRLNPDKNNYSNFWIHRSEVVQIHQVFMITRDMEQLSKRRRNHDAQGSVVSPV